MDFHKTWYVESGTPAHYCFNGSNDDPGVTLTFFTARSNLVTKAFLWENSGYLRNYCSQWPENL